ncbi:ferredoxin--NADP+ reductase [Quadrisphaera granulorum]|uniref:ferredoxin--NADP(+) reductase n=1 Tax=Quadrisphaera granulorum TaxID=317664 RepID=A0A315ZK57_9ACTN|nr:FAD-dependent oxidoreductase [Quadrisphaera granulorum]PWJ45619.1 ferredoxin--NADP+ reductase [Quadrisphaera granulorum]SZE99150.1 ferredoxin--NADP+ reductase [Quadrisphaera granulorum]
MSILQRPLRVAVVGAGPAGIYASDILSRADLSATAFDGVSIDLLERLPAPFGLVRYGVAPDHPRIKQIVVALERVLGRGDIRLLSNVDVGTDLTLSDLQRHYDAVVFSTGAIRDAVLDIPGVDLDGCYGAADFVSWYDGHPDVPREWPLHAREIAVIGAGNVALDVARVLAKHPADLLPTEIPDNVHAGLERSPVTDVHVFARRGPAQAKFSPLELRELGHVPDVDVIVDPEDFDFDDASLAAIESSNQTKQVVRTLTDWAMREEPGTASRRIHLHFLHAPVEILGDDDGRVVGLRTERTELTGDGTVRGTGTFHEWDVQAVYRAVGYASSPVAGVPFDERAAVIPNTEGRVLDETGQHLPGLYCTGWVKRGPVGLIGHTKSDAAETVRHLVADLTQGAQVLDGPLGCQGPRASEPNPAAVVDLLTSRGVDVLTWSGWQQLDRHERQLGEARGRERIKVVSREEMVVRSRAPRVPVQLPGGALRTTV